MFRVIPPDQRNANGAVLAAMHQLRDRIVVGEWGWEIPGARPGHEQDAFDTADTVYVIVEDEREEIAACARLNPTCRPHMMSELFSDYCDLQPFPARADVWECSRFVIDTVRGRDPLQVFRLRCQLGIGLTVHCLDNKITQLSWLTHQKFYNYISGLLRTEPLGRPRRQQEGWAWIAAVSDIELAALDRQLERLRRAPEIVSALLAGKAPGDEGQAA